MVERLETIKKRCDPLRLSSKYEAQWYISAGSRWFGRQREVTWPRRNTRRRSGPGALTRCRWPTEKEEEEQATSAMTTRTSTSSAMYVRHRLRHFTSSVYFKFLNGKFSRWTSSRRLSVLLSFLGRRCQFVSRRELVHVRGRNPLKWFIFRFWNHNFYVWSKIAVSVCLKVVELCKYEAIWIMADLWTLEMQVESSGERVICSTCSTEVM